MTECIDKTEFLLNTVYKTGGFVREEFTSAAGIRGNLKIELPKVFDGSPEALSIFAGTIAEELKDTDLLIANGGALPLCKEVEKITGKPRVVIQSVMIKGVKNFRLCDHAFDKLKGDPTVGLIEDVSSTLGSVERMLAQTGLRPLVSKVAVGWRRGHPAPAGMTPEVIDSHNQHFNFRDLYEHNLGIPVTSVIERYLPLWIPVEPQIKNYIPELA